MGTRETRWEHEPGTRFPQFSLHRFEATSVELLVNGLVVQRSVSFPFNLNGIAPNRTAQSSNFVVQIRATDTAGNASLSDPVVADLVFDPVPPVLLTTTPTNTAHVGRGFSQARLSFPNRWEQPPHKPATSRSQDPEAIIRYARRGWPRGIEW